jgi:hypothetical protein
VGVALKSVASIKSARRLVSRLTIGVATLASASAANAAQILDATVIWQTGGNGADKALNEPGRTGFA